MRLATLRLGGLTAAVRLESDHVVELPHADVGALLASGPDWAERAAADGPRHALDETAFAPVVPNPSKFFCVGVNYLAHIHELKRDVPTHPTVFAKFPEALTGPRDDIALPPEAQQVDWEGELAVVIGQRVRRADEAAAAAAIAGFTVCNDLSMRDWQRRTLQWLQGKTWEACSPLGPVLVTADELGGPEPDLDVRTFVDDVEMQHGRSGDLCFKPIELVRYLSTIITLNPGDVISTGTPGGVGEARDPQIFLRPGNVLRTEVSGIGACVNRMVAG